MREKTGDKFFDDLFNFDLFGFLDSLIDSGAEVHIVDRSDPDKVEEHIFNREDEIDCELDIDVGEEGEDDIPFCDEDCCNACEECKHFGECYEDELYHEPDMWGIPDIERVLFSGPATIVFWADKTKTVVKCMDGQPFEKYAGFAAACMKKMFGSTSRAKAILEEVAEEEVQQEKKAKDSDGITDALAQQEAHNEAIQEAIDEALG